MGTCVALKSVLKAYVVAVIYNKTVIMTIFVLAFVSQFAARQAVLTEQDHDSEREGAIPEPDGDREAG